MEKLTDYEQWAQALDGRIRTDPGSATDKGGEDGDSSRVKELLLEFANEAGMIAGAIGRNIDAVNIVSTPEIYTHEWVTFTTRQFPENARARCGDDVQAAFQANDFSGIDQARFRQPVTPGDQLRFELELVKLRGPLCKMTGVAYVGDDKVAEAELMSTVVDR